MPRTYLSVAFAERSETRRGGHAPSRSAIRDGLRARGQSGNDSAGEISPEFRVTSRVALFETVRDRASTRS